MQPTATNLGALDLSLYPARSVRDEIRENLRQALRTEQPLFDGILGYDKTVIPQIINALLAKHDIILLGLRGQAKTRLARLIPALLDEWRPFIIGSPLREHPAQPLLQATKDLIAKQGDHTPIGWLHRDDRYGEKLATPDVTVADLIGDIDPLKAAHRKLDLSDEEVIHYGIIPRTNHGVFCINEVPDLAPRIQVALLNILEEQDIQIRGFPLRIPMDVLMVFTANPEDYTNRGSIITPLKDRIASQITTHYPADISISRSITEDQAWTDRGETVSIPDLAADLIEAIAFQGRESEYIDQKSGVSARLSIAARELLQSQIEQRCLRHGDQEPPTPRLVDFLSITPAVLGKVELVYEGEQEGADQVATHLIGKAAQMLFDTHFPQAIVDDDDPSLEDDTYQSILTWFAQGNDCDLSDQQSQPEYQTALSAVAGLQQLTTQLLPNADKATTLFAMELILEGLHQHSLLSKQNRDTGTSYGDMLKTMLGR